jgi:hypothetical protein
MRAVNNKFFPRAMAMAVTLLLTALSLSTPSQAQGPALTTISDTVYRADGTPAEGTVLISWPSFQTADGDAVAAGNLSVTLGSAGAFAAQLVPNVGASPAGTFYVVVLQLDDGTVRTEYWTVPTTSPTTIAGVLTTPGTGLANLAATQQYVNTAVAGLAVDATVVHLAGTETITGTKQFTAPPSLPTPVGTNDGANKAYVDAAVANVGSGAYVAIAGATMTGPLNLPADPASPTQAADRHYVDNGLSAKADLVNATVPTGELGAGVASSATCLNGSSQWGSCGSGAPAGITYATTALNWAQTISTPLAGGTPATVTLTPCPVGIDTTSGFGYQVLLSGGGNSEAASVATVAGGCTSGAASGTITVTPFYSYPAGYTIGSASSGIQETYNAACGTSATFYKNVQCNVIIPSNGPYTSSQVSYSLNNYNVYGTIFLHSSQSTLDGNGVALNCMGRGPCVQIGVLGVSSTHFGANKIDGITFRAGVVYSSESSAFAGVNITNTAGNGTYRTITTATPHNFRPGDLVTILFTDSSIYWGDATVYDCGNGASAAACTSSSTTFRYAAGSAIAPAASPGVVALAYAAVLDNGMSTTLSNIQYDLDGGAGEFNNFFDMWDDENATISHFSNQGGGLNASATWAGSYVFSGGATNGSGYQLAPVITLRDSTLTADFSNAVTVYNSNGLYIDNTVIQSTGLWEIYGANTTGNYQGTNIQNLYNNGSSCCTLNPGPPSAARSPFPGLGGAGFIAGPGTAAAYNTIKDGGGVTGYFRAAGTGNTYQFSYFIVANDTTTGKQTSPMQILNWSSTGTDSIPVTWPRVASGADVITYDVIRTGGVGSVGSTYPYTGGCLGGAGTTCGYVAQGLSQSAACAGTLVCSYTDNGSASTLPYATNPTLHPLIGTYTGPLSFWPGALVVVGAGDSPSVIVDEEQSPVVGVGLHGNPVQVAHKCGQDGQTSSGGYTACFASNTVANNAVRSQTALLLSDGGVNNGAGSDYFSKGRLNFTNVSGLPIYPHHIITLVDSQPGMTQATIGERPPASPNDVWIGTDANIVPATMGQLSFGAPVSITSYIAQIGDGIHANWLERLSATLKEFNVPTKFDQSVTLAGLSNGCLNISSGVIASTGSACGGGGGGNVNSVFGRTGAVVATTGDYTVSQVTGAAVDAAVVHNTGTETIGGAKTFTNTVTMSSNLLLPQGSGYVPAVGGIGFDTAAGLPVINISGTTQQVALTSSNISGQAGTALALAGSPTQCSGSFATGIAANGNANCAIADVIQLQETTPPAGIPGWGEFWFDSTYHAPFFIDNDGQAVQLGLTNLFNSDPGGDKLDNLEERNGANAENLRVYSSYLDSGTTWQRISLGYDAADGSGYEVLRSENSTSSSAPGLGFWIGSALKWVVDAAGNLKPWPVTGLGDNQFNIGSDSGNAVKSIFANTSFNMNSNGRQDFEFANDGTNGTTLNQLAVYDSSGAGVQTAATTSTDGVVGIVSSGAGTTNKAVITWAGVAACIFDASNPIAGDYVVASTTQPGKCHDTGLTTRPTGVQVIGRIEDGEVRVSLGPPSGSGGGAVSSVFGRTGAVTAATGDYSVSQVTGAAVDSTVVHLAGTETITGAKTFSSNLTLTGNLNVAGNINQTGSGPTQWSGQEWAGTTVTVPSGMAFSLGVGSDNTFHCQLASGTSCMPSGGGIVYPGAGIPNSTGSAWSTSYNTSGAGTTLALTASPVFTGTPTVPGYVPTSTTVNGHALTSNVTVSASDLTTGTIPVAQLPVPTCSWITVPTESGSGNAFPGTTNRAIVWGLFNPYPCVTNHVAYVVGTADNTSNNYALGLMTGSSGGTATIIASTASTAGTTFAPAAGIRTIAWNASNITVPAGRIYIALTSNCTSACAALLGTAGNGVTYAANQSVSVGTGGAAFSGAITLPTDSFSSGASIPALVVF